MKVLIIIPAFNEQDSILSVVSNIEAHGYDYIVVNDGSKDGTLRICQENNINVLNLSQNLGIGGAVQAGHKYAKRNGYDVAIQFDGDGQHDADCIERLLSGIRAGGDLVVGSRFVGETEGFKSTLLRRVGINWLRLVIRLFSGKTITDATSGFRACNRRAIDLFCSSYPIDYPEPESIVVALKSGLSVEEVPVVMHERIGGESSIRPLNSIYYMIKVTLAIMVAGMHRGER